MLKKIALLVLINALSISMAQATILFTPSITYMEQELDDNGTQGDAKLTFIDLRLGYVTSFGLYLGGLYSIHDYDLLADSSDSYFGPSIGYYNSGFLVVGTYYIFGERDITSGGTKYSGVNGFQIDLSYSVPITPMISVGPQLTYHSIEFDEAQNSGISSSTDYSISGVTPYFNITFMF